MVNDQREFKSIHLVQNMNNFCVQLNHATFIHKKLNRSQKRLETLCTIQEKTDDFAPYESKLAD